MGLAVFPIKLPKTNMTMEHQPFEFEDVLYNIEN